MRLDRFLVHDASVLGGVVARYFGELEKRRIAGGTSLSQAARNRTAARGGASAAEPESASASAPASASASASTGAAAAAASASASSASSAASASAYAPAAAASASPPAFASASPPAAAAAASASASASTTTEAALAVGDAVVSEHCDARIKALHADDTATVLYTGTQLEKRVPCVRLERPRSSPPPPASPRVNDPLYDADGAAANPEAMRILADAAGITFDASLSPSRMAHGGGARSGVFRQQVAQMFGGRSIYVESDDDAARAAADLDDDTARAIGAYVESDEDAARAAADSDDDPSRTIDAAPDQWRRGGGISTATRDAIAAVNAALRARPLSQGKLATELVSFAFGGGQPRLPPRARRSFPDSQWSMSVFLAGRRNLSGAICAVIEAWARSAQAQAA